MDLDAKLAVLDEKEREAPDEARWSYERGVAYEEARDRTNAMEAYRTTLQRDPDHLFAHINLGRLHDDRAEWDDALALYDRALTLPGGPEDDILLSNRANTLLSLERVEEALASYRAALAIVRDPAILQGLQTALGWLGHVDELNAIRPEDEPGDRGPFFEVTHPLERGGRVVARFWSGRHTRPEMLMDCAQRLVDHVVRIEGEGAVLANGDRFLWGWSILTVRRRGDDLVLCEPSYRDPSLNLDVGFTLQTDLMQVMMIEMVETPPDLCSSQGLVTLRDGALQAERVSMTRYPGTDRHTGWVAAPTDATPSTDLDDGWVIPSGALVPRRHPLLKPLFLPVGWTAHFDQHAVISVMDPDGRERWNVD